MKKLLKLFAVLSLLSVVFVSCSDDDDDYSLDKYWVSYGTVESEGSNYMVRTDDGSKLYIVSNLLPQYKFTDGQRLVVNYTILGDMTETNDLNVKSYYIRLNGLYEVLTKGTIAQSFIDKDAEHRQDSIGKTPIAVVDAWFGSKYLNINFEYLTNPSLGVRHMISLVRNDNGLNAEGEVELTLRHNAYTDVPPAANPMRVAFGRVSFDISSVLAEGENSAKIRLIWEEYGERVDDRVTKSDSGTFTMPSWIEGKPTTSVGRYSGLGTGLNIKPKESNFRLNKIATIVE